MYDLMGNIIAEANGTGTIQSEYVYLNGERLAIIDTANAEIYYYHNDHLSTPKALTDETSTVVWQADYTPFGELTEVVNLVEQPFRFPGQYFDSETGLHYNYFRDYDPSIGRYVQSDPIGLAGRINTYSYAESNAMRYMDPTGLVAWEGRVTGGAFLTAGMYVFTLTSECVDGERAHVRVVLVGPGLGFGARVSGSSGGVSLQDPYEVTIVR